MPAEAPTTTTRRPASVPAEPRTARARSSEGGGEGVERGLAASPRPTSSTSARLRNRWASSSHVKPMPPCTWTQARVARSAAREATIRAPLDGPVHPRRRRRRPRSHRRLTPAAWTRGAGHLDLDLGVGQQVLHAPGRSRWPPELRALLGVGGAEVDGGLGQPDLHRGRQQRAGGARTVRPPRARRPAGRPAARRPRRPGSAGRAGGRRRVTRRGGSRSVTPSSATTSRPSSPARCSTNAGSPAGITPTTASPAAGPAGQIDDVGGDVVAPEPGGEERAHQRARARPPGPAPRTRSRPRPTRAPRRRRPRAA